jgi:hypothetical protein
METPAVFTSVLDNLKQLQTVKDCGRDEVRAWGLSENL